MGVQSRSLVPEILPQAGATVTLVDEEARSQPVPLRIERRGHALDVILDAGARLSPAAHAAADATPHDRCRRTDEIVVTLDLHNGALSVVVFDAGSSDPAALLRFAPHGLLARVDLDRPLGDVSPASEDAPFDFHVAPRA